MNVAHFASDFYPNPGGVQEFVRQLTRQQNAEGGNPLIITNRWPKTLPRFEVYERVPVYRIPFRVPEPNWRQLTGAALFFAPTLLHILHILEEQHAELLHIQCVGSNAFYALHASRWLNLPMVATLHGELSVDSSGLFEHSPFARKLLKVVMETADLVTACSLHTLREAEDFLGKPLGERGRVIHNGVRNEEFLSATPYAHSRPYLFSIGRHVRQKGFDLLLRAFAEVLQTGPVDHDLILAGDGPERKGLEHLATMLGLDGRVHFVGTADRVTTARLFAGCSFFVLSSRQEPLGIVNLEAMASGKPILATRVGGVPEIVIDGQNGLLVEPENVNALTEGIKRLMADRDLRMRLGMAGKERARCFDWCGVAAKYASIYESIQGTPERNEPQETHG